MKRSLLTFMTLAALSTSLYAYSQADRIKDMRTMAQALSDVQKGILYNNKKLVHEGVSHLKTASGNIQIAPKNVMDYSSVFAKEQAAKIVKYADRLDKSMKEGQKHAALTEYTSVLNQCVSCHNKIRKWNR
ncbi:hypothetical protein [Sulfurovum sp.]|uniref:hypothetical protein n=1 Tax=Sulfurovum sp. TaxID=1969726 RepID=UPI0025F855D7|nr:hypothetical protein [Sulfurovum sp.]